MKKLLSLFLCLVLLFGLLPLAAPARAATALSLSSVKADKTSANVGAAVTWTATASGGTGTLKYYFILYKDGTKIATRSYSTAKSFSYTPTEAGTYKARVYVKDADGTKVNKLSAAVTVAPLTLSSVKADKTSAGVGATITWTASASGGTGTLRYYFKLYKDGTKLTARAYSTVNTFSYTPTEAGSYKVRVYVKDADGTKVSKLSAVVTVAPLTLSSVKADKTSADTEEKITWTATASGGSGTLKYYFILYKDGSKIATRSYSTAKSFSYTPAEAGTYKVRVYVKDADGTKVNKLSGAVTVTSKASLYVSSCIYITSKEPSSSVYVNGRVVDYYNGYLDGAAMCDLALDSAPKKTGFAAYSKSSSGIYTLHFLPAGNGSATGVRTFTLENNSDPNVIPSNMFTNSKLYLKDDKGEWQTLDLSGVTVTPLVSAASIGLSLNSMSDVLNVVSYGYKVTVTLVENVVGGVHSVGGSAIYVTVITQ